MKANKEKVCCLIFLFQLFSVQFFAQKSEIDLIVFNANIRTMYKKLPKAQALAVADGKIFAIGTDAKIRALAAKNTQMIDAGGKLILPGFNDAHVHLTGIGNLFSTVDLREVESSAEIVEKLQYYTRFLPKNRWVLGSGWNPAKFSGTKILNKKSIDAVTLNNPVLFYNSDGKTILVNSLALKIAGIEKNTYIENKSIERDASGEPTGIIKDSAIEIVRKHVPKNHTQNWFEVIETAGNFAASLGVTSVQDVHSDDLLDVSGKLHEQGKLKTRIYDCYYFPSWKKLVEKNLRRATGSEMVRGGCLKYFSEGDYDALPELVNIAVSADKADLQIMMHAIGGAANDIVLKVYETVEKQNGKKDRRFRVEHAYNFRLPDLPRFAALKIIPSLQPHLFSGDEPYRALLDSGAKPAFGSDASITDFNPILGIHAAVNSPNSLNGRNQSISVEEAVNAYTTGSAYAEFQEKVKGSLSAGKLADFVILSEDIFSINPDQIKNAKVLQTFLGGRIVFESL